MGIHQGTSDFFSTRLEAFVLNKPLQEIQTSLCSADSPLLSSPQRLQQLVHGFPAIIQQLSLQRTSLKELISSELLQMPHRFCHSCRAPLHAADKPSQGPAGKKQRAEVFSARRWVVRRLYSFHPFSSPARTSIPLRLRAIWSHSVEAMMDDSLSLAASDAEEVSGLYHWPRPLVFCAAQRIQHHHGCRYYLSNAVEELGLEWSSPEEPGWMVLDGASPGPSSTSFAILPRSPQRDHQILA